MGGDGSCKYVYVHFFRFVLSCSVILSVMPHVWLYELLCSSLQFSPGSCSVISFTAFDWRLTTVVTTVASFWAPQRRISFTGGAVKFFTGDETCGTPAAAF